MKPSLDRILKVVWLAIGGLLLGSLLVALVFVAAGFLRTRGASEAATAAASGVPSSSARPARAAAALAVAGTDTRLVPVERGGGTPPLSGPGRLHGLVNAVFLDPGGEARLLLDRPALIRSVWYPAANGEETAGSSWIAWEIAFGEAAAGAPSALYLSDLDGRTLRPVVEPPLRYRAHQSWDAGRILVFAEDEAGTPRAFLYDDARRRLAPFAALDSTLIEARRIAEGSRSP